MRVARIIGESGWPESAVVIDDRVYVVPGASSVQVLVDAFERPGEMSTALAAAGAQSLALKDVALLAPLEPPTIRDFVAFEEHVEGVARSVSGASAESAVAPEWHAAPAFYFSNPYAVVGPHDDVPVPPGCSVLDFELEVAAIIGRAGRDLNPKEGQSVIAGYTIMNDWSARDLQRTEMKVGLGPAKGKDSATTLGPWIVTADELESYLDDEGFLALPMTVEVNGVEIGRDLLSNMGWPFGELVAHASRGTWVRPGDVLGSGTCGNGGCLAELWGRRGEQTPPPLQVGDVVTMTVGGIGVISNRVVTGAEFCPVPAARPRPRNRP